MNGVAGYTPTQAQVPAKGRQGTFYDPKGDASLTSMEAVPPPHHRRTESHNLIELSDQVAPARVWFEHEMQPTRTETPSQQQGPVMTNVILGFAEYLRELTAGTGLGEENQDALGDDTQGDTRKSPIQEPPSDTLGHATQGDTREPPRQESPLILFDHTEQEGTGRPGVQQKTQFPSPPEEQEDALDTTPTAHSVLGKSNALPTHEVEQEPQSVESEDAPLGAPSAQPSQEATTLGTSGAESQTPKGQEEVVICRLRSCSTLSVPLKVENLLLRAIVDTAAEVTIISDRVLQALVPPPPKVRDVTLNTAGRDLKMQGQVVGPVRIRLGSEDFMEEVYVAPTEDDMLLGLDFLRRHEVDVQIKDMNLVLKGKKIPMELGSTQGPGKVAKVYVSKRVVVPPNSARKVAGNLGQHMECFMFEPSMTLPALAPRAVYEGGQKMVVYVLNPSGQAVQLVTNSVLGQAQEVSVISEQGTSEGNSPTVREIHEDIEQAFPEHLQDLVERSSENLQDVERQELKRLVHRYSAVFARDEFDLGNFTAIEHHIDTAEASPIKQKMRRTPLSFAAEEKAHLDKMERAGVIQPSQSEWASAPVLVRKRDGGVRWCIDYRALNSVTRKDVYPLPNIEECLDTLAGNTWFSKLDANSAYWQVRISDQDRRRTAFTTKYGLYEFIRMGFGLCNAPATFSRAMDLVLRGLNWDVVLAFLDDIVVLGRSFQDHLNNLEHVFQRFEEFQLKLKPKKCELFRRKVEFLGREVGEDKISLKEDHVKAVREWPCPTCVKHVERFLGLVNYHRSFLKNYAAVAVPLYRVTGKNKFTWGPEQQEAFEEIKRLLASAPVLALPNERDLFILDTDASNDAIGAELLQVQGGQEKVVAYGSISLAPEQRRYCVTRRELLAVVRFTRQYRHYLLGKPFVVRTDHSSLSWLLSFKYPQGQLARWMEELSQFNMKIEHRPGKKHANADALSRVPSEEFPCEEFRLGTLPEDLPCGGCHYCRKAHQNWSSFAEQVDDIVPLAYLPKGVKQVTEGDPPVLEYAVTHGDLVACALAPDWIWDIAEEGECYIQEVTAGDPVLLPEDHIRTAQEQDSQLSPLREWLNSQTELDEGTMMLWGPAQKYLWVNRESFHLVRGIICKCSEEQNLLWVPQSLREEVIRQNHDLPSAAHQGRERTAARIKLKYVWYGMSQDIKEYVRHCPICEQNKKPNRYNRCPMTRYHAGVPMERVHLDFLGPLPKTPRGNLHILVMIDQFTKWIECIPLPSQTAEETARAAVGEFFSRFGYPLQVFTDQGRNFESRLFVGLCKLLQIHKARTTPYRPSANGQVERVNRTLIQAVRCFIGKAQNKWDEYLPQIAGALRSTVNSATGFTPNRLMLGREVHQPADLLYPVPKPRDATELVEDYQARLRKALNSAHEVARSNLKGKQKRMKKDYDLKAHLVQYKEGDLVYVLDTAQIKGKCRKLSAPWKGPALILKRLSPYLYQIRLKNATFVANHDRLKACHGVKVPAWAEKLPSANSEEVYCICRQPEDGHFMIQCDKCDEWFHGRCVGVSSAEGVALDKYYCPKCRGG